MSETPELLWDIRAELGEGPVWDAARRCVWFVDIKWRKLHRYGVDDGTKTSWDTPDQTGFALPAVDGSLICGVKGGLYRFTLETGDFALIQPVETDRPGNRLNDGFVAPDGTLWFGSMDDAEEAAAGALYRWRPGQLTRMDDGYGITNGPALSPDGRTMYHHDTARRTVFAFDHAGGELSNRRVFAMPAKGYPDGPSVDSAGVVHVGLFHGGGVARFSPDGVELEPIAFPVPTVTKASFGGDDLKTLYCTTAKKGQDDAIRAAHPTMGGLYAVRVGTPGLPQALVGL
jgi:D-xylonolactonase